MSSGTPYIGSKISLISKAEIRYEGILYDVNSKEATVTLSKVKSYGTESRRASKQIPPRDEVYEYIIFRGSDIKDLSVSQMGNKDEEPHQDPAILSAQTAPPPVSITRSDPARSSSTSSSSSSILPTPPRPVQPAGYTQFPPGLGGYNPFGSMPYFGRPPPPHSMMMGHHQTHQQQINQSRQTLPTNISTISSAISQGNTTSSSKNTETTPTIPTTMQEMTPGAKPYSTDSHMPVPSKQGTTGSTTEHPVPSTSQQQQQLSSNQGSSDAGPTNDGGKKSSSGSPTSSNGDKKKSKREGRKDTPKYTNYTPRGPYGANHHWAQGNNRKGYRPPRGGQSGGGGGGYNPTPNRPPPQSNTGSQPLKYTKDFDFESANALFSKDQLEQEMKSKLRINSDQDDAVEGGVSEGNEPLSPDGGEQEELEEGEIEKDDVERISDVGYDKTKSFFDSISCESSTTNKRSNRSQEMALNTETFGVSHNNRGYNRSRGNQGRGGYNPRYRGGGRGRYNHYNGYNSSYRGGYYSGRGGGGGRRSNDSYGGRTEQS